MLIAIRNSQGEVIALMTIEEYLAHEAEELLKLMDRARYDPMK